MLECHGYEADVLHVGDELVWHLLENLLSEVTPCQGLVELYKLDDVARRRLSAAVSETTAIAIELLHGGKVGAADSHDNYGAGHASQLADQVLGQRHVVDGAIRQDQQDLVAAGAHRRLDVVPEFGQDRREDRWATEPDLAESLLVRRHDVLDTHDVGIGSVAVHCEAVTDVVDSEVSRNATEPEDGERAITIVRLDDETDVQQSPLVLVVRAQVVERVSARRVTVRSRVVDSGGEGDLPTRSEVVNERGPHVDLKAQYLYLGISTSIMARFSTL